jgi:ankyrin repeat protein
MMQELPPNIETARRLEAAHLIIEGAQQNDLGKVEAALELDPPCVNACDPRSGLTALHIAAADGNRSLVRFLLSRADCAFSPEDRLGRTPVQLAYVIGRDDIVDDICSSMAADLSRRFPELNEAEEFPPSIPVPPRPAEP